MEWSCSFASARDSRVNHDVIRMNVRRRLGGGGVAQNGLETVLENHDITIFLGSESFPGD